MASSASTQVREGWQELPLIECTSDHQISYGVVQPGFPVTDGVPIVRVNNLVNGRIITHDAMRIAPEIDYSHRRTKLRGGEIVISLVGTTGSVAIVPGELAGWNVARAIAVIRPDEKIGASWLKLCLESSHTREYLDARANTTVQKTLNLKDVKQLPIPLPPPHWRQEILSLVSPIENAITNLEDQNRSLEATAQTIFKSWFVDFDPVRARAEGREPAGMDAATAALFPSTFEDSELGPIPQGWTIHGIDTIATFLNGIALQKYPAMEGEEWLPAIKIAQLKCGSVDGADRISPSIPEKYIVQDGDLLFSWSGSLEVEFWTGGKGALNQHLFKVFSAQFPQWFVYLWLRFHLDGFREIAESKVTTMGHIQRHHLSEAIVVIPPPETLRGLDRFLGPLIEKVVAGRLQARTLAELRDTLLPRLISGKLRVPEVEAMLTGGCREV